MYLAGMSSGFGRSEFKGVAAEAVSQFWISWFPAAGCLSSIATGVSLAKHPPLHWPDT
jgi:hypothetical protein